MITRLLQIILAFWAGSLWTICGIVAPSLFAVTPDRHLAGEIAGHFFRVESWLGLALGGVVFVLLPRAGAPLRNNTNYALAIVTTAAPVSNEVVLRPIMEAARASGDSKIFGMLHGGAALLFGLACLTALILLWRATKTNAS